jgi:hypothetical protein
MKQQKQYCSTGLESKGTECTLFKVAVIPCGSEDPGDYAEEPYEMVLCRSNTIQQNLKDILNENQ